MVLPIPSLKKAVSWPRIASIFMGNKLVHVTEVGKRNRKPLSPRDGLGATRARVPDGEPWVARDFIWHLVSTQRHRHPLDDESAVTSRFTAGEVVLIDGTPLTPSDLVRAGTDVFFYRRPAPEPRVPFEVTVVYEDDAIMVVNKPPFLATMPRASHITENATVRLRRSTGNEELTPAHRLDRMTSGLLLFTKKASVRGAYQQLFASRAVAKLYEAVADDIGPSLPARPSANSPLVWEHHIVKREGELASSITVDAIPNSLTYVTDITPLQGGTARYLLQPVTGRTHQLRVQMHAAGAPIHGDPVYPELLPASAEDFSRPMLLAAVGLAFTDPLTGAQRIFSAAGFSGLPVPTA
ncbi:23S rRNA pseudouridylate synthase [Corynebacterium sp. CCUG 70398]|nr:23S rRNA pseudouridylate synthase [Corynebacterium sp. CCUG 70398]